MENQDSRKQKLFEKYLNNTCSRNEMDQFIRDVASDTTNHYWDELYGTHWKNEMGKLPLPIPAISDKGKINRRLTYLIGFVTTAAAVWASVAIMLNSAQPSKQVNKIQQSPVVTQMVVPEITKASQKLTDGTEVFVKKKGTKVIPEKFEVGQRKVKFQGEAFFKVAHDKTRPFIITTPDFTIKVLGTSFDVGTSSSHTSAYVLVKTGKVQISLNNTSEKHHNVYILLPGGKFEYNPSTGKEIVTGIKEDERTELNGKEMVFCRTPLPDAVSSIESYYGIKIQLNVIGAENVQLTGKYQNMDINGVLELVTFATGTQLKQNGKNFIISK
jgi:transmembrane sensor